MDIAALATVSSQVQTLSTADTLVMKKVLENMDQTGQDTLSLLREALPHLGQNIDIQA
ncbi:MAG: YjfB family protein [Sporomusaceae bacterium]|nr:YjfB family protein [Sporomusaceae bacterium]